MDYKDSNCEPFRGQGKRWGKIATATKVARAVPSNRRHHKVDMKQTIFALLFIILACPVMAQELFINGGATQDVKTGTDALHWSVTYRQGLGEYAAFSLSYINEGHQPNHYRDGLAAQIWGRIPILNQRLSLALGIGCLAYADTKVSPVRDIYENAHGFGIISSGTATWQGLSPLLLQIRLDYIATQHSFDTLSATFGIGYLLDTDPSQGRPPNQLRADGRPTMKSLCSSAKRSSTAPSRRQTMR